MTRTVRRTSVGLLVAALVLGCGGGGGDGGVDKSCAPADPTCATLTQVYDVVLDAAPSDVGIMLVTVSAASPKTVTARGSARFLADSPPAGAGALGVIVLTPVPGQAFARITFDTPPTAPPVVTVNSAARNASGGYAVLPATEVQVRVQAVP